MLKSKRSLAHHLYLIQLFCVRGFVGELIYMNILSLPAGEENSELFRFLQADADRTLMRSRMEILSSPLLVHRGWS